MQNYFLEEELSVIYITVPSIEEGRTIAKTLVEEKLAGCVSIIPEIISTYLLEGKVEEYSETQLLVKTKSSLFEKLSNRVKKIHSATLPEIFGVRIAQASNEYKMWLGDALK